MSDPYNDALDQFLRDTISTITEGQQTVTRWVLVWEVSDGDTRIIQNTASDTTTTQDLAGMLAWVTESNRRQINRVLDILDS